MTNIQSILIQDDNIPIFHGRINGQLHQNINSFIEALEHHYTARNITEDSLKISIAKSYIDISEGDACLWLRSLAILKCNTSITFKERIREIYNDSHRHDPVQELSEIIRLDRNQGSFSKCNAIINDKVVDFEKISISTNVSIFAWTWQRE